VHELKINQTRGKKMKVNKDKQYRTRQGGKVNIYEVDEMLIGKYAVIGAYFDGSGWHGVNWNIDGLFDKSHGETCLDLIEVSPYDDFKIDDKVLVKNRNDNCFTKRHFAGVHHNGQAKTFDDGATSFTTNGNTSPWLHCEKYEEK